MTSTHLRPCEEYLARLRRMRADVRRMCFVTGPSFTSYNTPSTHCTHCIHCSVTWVLTCMHTHTRTHAHTHPHYHKHTTTHTQPSHTPSHTLPHTPPPPHHYHTLHTTTMGACAHASTHNHFMSPGVMTQTRGSDRHTTTT